MTGEAEGSPSWDAESVVAASNAWVWVPDNARTARAGDLLVVGYPDWFLIPTSVRVFDSERDPELLVEEVASVARGWGRDRVWWRLSDTTRPPSLEPLLLSRGAMVVDRMDVLALPLARGVPDLGVPGGVDVRRVTDEATLRHAYVVDNDAFGAEDPPDEQVAESLAEVTRGLADDSGARYVAYVDGRPAATGGYTIVDGVCRLWGGGSRTALRGRGAYRGVLAARLRTARAAGASLALTHGVVDTSSPTLRRAGFTRYGEERTLRLDLPPDP